MKQPPKRTPTWREKLAKLPPEDRRRCGQPSVKRLSGNVFIRAMKSGANRSRDPVVDLETARQEKRWLTPGERPPRPYMTFTPETPYLAKPCKVFALPIKNEQPK